MSVPDTYSYQYRSNPPYNSTVHSYQYRTNPRYALTVPDTDSYQYRRNTRKCPERVLVRYGHSAPGTC
eukprot:1732515-Rhodomonas_salina.2